MAARLTTFFVVAIVATTLIAGLIVGAQRDDSSGPVDLIIHNARVYTADADGTMAQAIAVRGNTILRVGTDREVMRYRRPQADVIDAHGAAVLPGFEVAHASLVAAGLARQEVDLSGATTVDDVPQRISAWAETHPEADLINGRGWMPAAFADAPTKTQLDAVEPQRPIVLRSADRHTAWVNSAALRAAGITRRAPRSEGGEIVRDRRGEPTGVLRGTAVDLLQRAMPAPSPDERTRALSIALDDAPRRGITSVHDFVERAADAELYERLREDQKRPDARVYFGVPAAVGDAAAGLDDLAKRFPDDPSIKTGFAYLPDGMAADDLRRAVAEIDRHEWQVAIEAPDPASVTSALDALEAAAHADRTMERRHRLEGVRDVLHDDLARMKRGGWAAVFLPSEVLSGATDDQPTVDAPSLDVLHTPMRTLQRSGVRLAFGTGAPDRSANPLASIASVVVHHGAPDEALTLKAAINAWTSGPAWASFDEHRKGTLEPGMLADIVVLSDDIFKMRPESIASATVEVTIIDGRIVYRRRTT
jgi:predicted amidohydrolase YtcJ